MPEPAPEDRWTGVVADSCEPQPVLGSVERYRGRVWAVRSDLVALGPAGQAEAQARSEERADAPDAAAPGRAGVQRDLVVHPGAVGVVALDQDDRVLLIRQYRHPVGRYLFEPPAGLLDAAGESPWETARRELVEEAGLVATDWQVLVDFFNSPGGTTESFRCFLARGLAHAPGGREHTGEAEEHHLPQAWVPLDEARDLVLSGRLQNPTAVIGILAAWAARATGWATLRPPDAAWPERDDLLAHGRVFGAAGDPGPSTPAPPAPPAPPAR